MQQHDADDDEQHANDDAVDVIERRMRLDLDDRARWLAWGTWVHDRLTHARTITRAGAGRDAHIGARDVATRAGKWRRVVAHTESASVRLEFMVLG